MTLNFQLVGPGTEFDSALGTAIKGAAVRKIRRSGVGSFCLTDAVTSGCATATFRLESQPDWAISIGAFPAAQELDSEYLSAAGKRCALRVHAANGGEARVLCDGKTSDLHHLLAWKEGDRIDVDVAFESATTARVSLRFKDKAETRLLTGVPEGGLRLGVGMQGAWTPHTSHHAYRLRSPSLPPPQTRVSRTWPSSPWL